MGVFTRGSTTTAAVKDGQKGKITKLLVLWKMEWNRLRRLETEGVEGEAFSNCIAIYTKCFLAIWKLYCIFGVMFATYMYTRCLLSCELSLYWAARFALRSSEVFVPCIIINLLDWELLHSYKHCHRFHIV